MIDEFLRPHATFFRLLTDWKKYGNITVGYDFDQTVCPFHDAEATFEQVRKLLRELKNLGCTCICWTANPDHSFVAKYVVDNNIPCDGINTDAIDLGYKTRKPFYSALLDDRAGLESMYKDLVLLVWYVKEHHLYPKDSKYGKSVSTPIQNN